MGVRADFKHRVHCGLEKRFATLGTTVEKNPWLTIFITVLISFLVGSGASNFYLESESYELWVPRSSMAYKHYKHIGANFMSGQRAVVMLYRAKDGGSVLREPILQELLSLHTNLTTRTSAGPDEANFQDMCNRASPELPCDFSNVLSVFNYDSATLAGAAALGQLIPAVQALEAFVPLTAMLGGIERDPATNEVLSAAVIRAIWVNSRFNTTDPDYFSTATRDNTEIIDSVLEWEEAVQNEFYWDWNEDETKLSVTDMLTNRSVDDEIGRLIGVDIMLFIISIFIIVLILAISFSIPPKTLCKDSRIAVGFASFFVVIFAVMFSFGLMGWFNVTGNAVCIMIMFIVAGVGVDDCIVVENFYSKAIEQGKPRGKRVSAALKRGGLAVFLTSTSSILAFASGNFSDMPGVVGFCTCGAFCFTWVFVLSVTFFPAMLVIDQRRIERGGLECLCCDTCCSTTPVLLAKKEGDGDESIAETKVGRLLTPILTSGAGKIMIPLVFGAWAAASTMMMLKNGVGLTVTDVVPDDSYIAELVETSREHWHGNSYRGMQIVMVGDFYDDEAKVAKMREYFEWLEGRAFIEGSVGMSEGTWYQHYTGYLDAKGLNRYSDFHANLSPFLEEFKKFRTEITCVSGDYGDCSAGIKCAKMPVWQTSKIDTFELYQIEVEINDKIEEMGFTTSYNWIDEFGYADADASIEVATLVSLSTCVAVVMALMLFLMDVGSSVCIFVCVAFVDMDLLGMMYYWDVKLSSISFSGLIMSIGLSVDYNIHIAHAFLEGKGGVVERTKHALDLMGPSVLKGGLTTFMGTVVLSQASSTVFRIFFKICFGTVVFGIAHGILLMPVLLGWYVTVFPTGGVVKVSPGL